MEKDIENAHISSNKKNEQARTKNSESGPIHIVKVVSGYHTKTEIANAMQESLTKIQNEKYSNAQTEGPN